MQKNNSDTTHSTKADRQLVVSRIRDKLREDIVSGVISPGAIINSVELARQFGTSRTPVREALLILVQDGLVSLADYRRPRVTQVSVDVIKDLYGFREALHAYIARTLVSNASDEELSLLRDMAIALLNSTADPAELHLQGVEAYHTEELRLCANEVMTAVLGGLKFKIRWFRRVGMPTREQFTILAHTRIQAIEACLERDAFLAEAISQSDNA